jgi:hypothetical protein
MYVPMFAVHISVAFLTAQRESSSVPIYPSEVITCRCAAWIAISQFAQTYQLQEPMWLTVVGIFIFSLGGKCIQEKSSASRSTLEPERAGVDADQTALQPDCRKGHSCLHMTKLLYTLRCRWTLSTCCIPRSKYTILVFCLVDIRRSVPLSFTTSKPAETSIQKSSTMTSKYNKQDLYDVEGLVAVVTGGMLNQAIYLNHDDQ